MNRRNDRAIISWRGTRNFRNKEVGGTARHGGPQPAMKLAYEVHLRVWNVRPREYALRENSVALVSSNETFSNFPRREETDIPSLLRREYSTGGEAAT